MADRKLVLRLRGQVKVLHDPGRLPSAVAMTEEGVIDIVALVPAKLITPEVAALLARLAYLTGLATHGETAEERSTATVDLMALYDALEVHGLRI